jgi:hypothetical protein
VSLTAVDGEALSMSKHGNDHRIWLAVSNTTPELGSGAPTLHKRSEICEQHIEVLT